MKKYRKRIADDILKHLKEKRRLTGSLVLVLTVWPFWCAEVGGHKR